MRKARKLLSLLLCVFLLTSMVPTGAAAEKAAPKETAVEETAPEQTAAPAEEAAVEEEISKKQEDETQEIENPASDEAAEDMPSLPETAEPAADEITSEETGSEELIETEEIVFEEELFEALTEPTPPAVKVELLDAVKDESNPVPNGRIFYKIGSASEWTEFVYDLHKDGVVSPNGEGNNKRFTDYVTGISTNDTFSIKVVADEGYQLDRVRGVLFDGNKLEDGVSDQIVSDAGYTFPVAEDKIYAMVIGIEQDNGGGGPGGEPQPGGGLSIVLCNTDENTGKPVEEISVVPADGPVKGASWDEQSNTLTLSSEIEENNRSMFEIRGGGHVAIRIDGQVNVGTFNIGDAEVEIRPAWDPGPEADPSKACMLSASLFCGTEQSVLKFRDYLNVVVGNPNAEDEFAFDNIGEVGLENYYFHRRDIDNNVNAAAKNVFHNVGKVNVISSKVKLNAKESPFAVESGKPKTVVTVTQEGVLDISGDGYNPLGDCVIKSKHYTSYPENGKAGDTDVDPRNPAGGLDSKYVAEDTVESGKTEDEMRNAGYNLIIDSANNNYHLESTDPLLYAIAYTVDDNAVDLIYNHINNNNVKKEDINPNGGTVIMSGFTKGYYVERDDRFEAWIAAGETVSVKILPDPGYQYVSGSLNVNGQFFDTTASDGSTDDAIGLYTYKMGAHAGHMSAGFIKTENLVVVNGEGENKCDSVVAKGSTIESEDINAQMTISGAAVDDTGKEKFGEKAPGMTFESFIDIKLDERTVKNYDVTKDNAEQAAWTKPREELDHEAEISIVLDPSKFAGTDITVVREHKGTYEKIPAKYNAATNKLTFSSKQFSTFAIGSDGNLEAPDASELGSDKDYSLPGMWPADSEAKDHRESISDATVTLSKDGKYTYTGKLIEPTVTVKLKNGKKLVNGSDYRVTYENATKAGTYTVTVSGINNFKDKATATLTIEGKKVTSLKFYPGSVMVDESGKPKNDYINLLVYDGTVRLTKDKDYELKDFKLSDNKKTATVNVVGKGNYKTSGDPVKTVKLTVAASDKKLITPEMVMIADQTYTGNALKPDVIIKDGDAALAKGTDFTVAYKNNKNVGTAYATITGKGNYAGKTIVQWNIKADAEKKLAAGNIVITTKAEKIIYNGKLQKPAVKVTNPYNTKKKLSKNKDYRIYYAKNLNVGEATVIIVGIGNFAGQRAETTFKILPCDIKKIKMTVTKGKLTAITFNGKKLTAAGEGIGGDYKYACTKEANGKYTILIDGTYKASDGKITSPGNFETKTAAFKRTVKDVDFDALGWAKPQ